MSDRTDKAKQKVSSIKDKMKSPIGGLDHPEPAQEAADMAGQTAGLAIALGDWSGRMQRRMTFGVRYLKAFQDVCHHAHLAFAQVAEEAIVDDESNEVVDTDSRIKGLHPEHERQI